jgi:hypothetical protein
MKITRPGFSGGANRTDEDQINKMSQQFVFDWTNEKDHDK